MAWWHRKKDDDESRVDPQVVDRLETVTRRLESFAEKLDRELKQIKQEEPSSG